jgi:oligoendopeptidase F
LKAVCLASVFAIAAVPSPASLGEPASVSTSTPAPKSATTVSSIARIEASYADWLDAVSAVSTIDSGLTARVADRGRDDWAARRRDLTAKLELELASADPKLLRAEDARALRAMRKGFADADPEEPVVDDQHPRVGCAQREDAKSDMATLQRALYACFEEIGNHISFDGQSIVRTTALQQLQQLDDGRQRKGLFLALSPLWDAVNGTDTAASPYRRMMKMAGAAASRSGKSPMSDAAATLGIAPDDVEQWLMQVLDAWRLRSGGPPLEPWDYWYDSAAASRAVSGAAGRESLLAIAKRFYRDLGADLDQLGVRHDLDVRPGKAPLAYTDLVRMGRRIGDAWLPAQARVSANYEQGGLFVVNELIHEDGHAVHYLAVRTRPAYFSLGDDLFFEAFADVPAWSSSEPPWQQKYLGVAADEGSSLRELYSNVVLDVAWSLFELRMFKNPTADPNALWTQITSHYLNIAPHPELSWWALRVQLVRWPGYMINYGLGAVLTADIRERTRESIGQFDTGNRRWYEWTSTHLLRYGSSVATPQLLRGFLGRPVSPAAILAQMQRVGPRSTNRLAGQHLKQALFQQLDGLIDVGFIDHQRRHEAYRAQAAGQQDEPVVVGARDQRVAEFLGR